MKKLILLVLPLLAACARKANPEKDFMRSLYKTKDLTAENMFSGNIEGPAVDADGKLFVVNYLRDGTIGWVQPDGKAQLMVTLPGKSIGNSIQFNRKGQMLVADFIGHNILEINPVNWSVTTYCHNESFNQPNDICINSHGIIFASDPNWQKQTGQLWRIDTDGKSTLLKGEMGTCNGICLSPDEKTLYVNESIQRRIWSFDVDEQGNISNQRIFAVMTDSFGMDGMKCDVKGNLYVCRYGKGAVAIYSPAGKLKQEVSLKGKDVSNITFGGKDFKTCFVTLQDRKCMEMFRSEIAGR
jgi:sugar lactone lactonase YvrE